MHINTVWSILRALRRSSVVRKSAGAAAVAVMLLLSASAPLDGLLLRDLANRKGASSSTVSSAPHQSRASRSIRYRTLTGRKPVRRAQSSSASSVQRRQPASTLRIRSAAQTRTADRSPLRQGPPVNDRFTPATAAMTASPSVHVPAAAVEGFPAFMHTVHPVTGVPNWGSMTTPKQWNRPYTEMTDADFVPVPGYDLEKLVVPLQDLLNPRQSSEITRKLYYSTRFFGAYDIDTGEFSGNHPGVDLKLALGQPLLAIAGGRVETVAEDSGLGIHVIIEHRHPSDGTFYSVYGHLGTVDVQEGAAVTPGQRIGTVGLTGKTSGPHLHLQVDRDDGTRPHTPYVPASTPSPAEAAMHSVNPAEFIRQYQP